jgi:hypothetical protein
MDLQRPAERCHPNQCRLLSFSGRLMALERARRGCGRHRRRVRAHPAALRRLYGDPFSGTNRAECFEYGEPNGSLISASVLRLEVEVEVALELGRTDAYRRCPGEAHSGKGKRLPKPAPEPTGGPRRTVHRPRRLGCPGRTVRHRAAHKIFCLFIWQNLKIPCSIRL